MKKILFILILIFIISLPLVAYAQMFSVPKPTSFTSLQAIIKAIVQVAFMAAGLVAVIFLIIGGFKYITASGNPEGVESAKATIINAIIGLVVILISFLIVNYVLQQLKVGPLYQLGVETVRAEGILPTGEKASIPDPLKGAGVQGVITAGFNIAYGVAGLVAVIYLIIGGYQYMTSAGNPDVSEQAKSTIVNSIIGLIIILTSYLVIRFALDQLHAGGILG